MAMHAPLRKGRARARRGGSSTAAPIALGPWRVETAHIPAADGAALAVHMLGEGPPLMLLHGLFSSAETNWLRYGTARRLAEAGHRVILPDLRGHGASQSPAEASGWPPDVLARDAQALVEALGLGPDLVLGGYSLGARTVLRCLVRGLRPRAAILAGMGLEGVLDPAARADWFVRVIEGRGSWPRGSAEAHAEAFMTAHVASPGHLVHLLRGQLPTEQAALAALQIPMLVVAGAEDRDNGSAEALARALPMGRFATIPGNHMSAVTRPELAGAICAFLANLGQRLPAGG
jgi:pimeloyl-ACP methyl ester carboxylesterase